MTISPTPEEAVRATQKRRPSGLPADLAERAREVAARAPELTEDQISRLAALFRPVLEELHSGGDSVTDCVTGEEARSAPQEPPFRAT